LIVGEKDVTFAMDQLDASLRALARRS